MTYKAYCIPGTDSYLVSKADELKGTAEYIATCKFEDVGRIIDEEIKKTRYAEWLKNIKEDE